MAANLADLMIASGVINYPVWFSKIQLPHWPMDHQMETVKIYARYMRYGDFSDPGTGKTFPAQIHATLMAALGNKVAFVMPPKLIFQFYDEFLNFFVGVENYLNIAHLNVPAAAKAKLMKQWDANGWPDVLLLSYDVYRTLNDPAPMKKVGPNLWFLEDGRPYFVEKDVPVDSKATPYTKDGRRINSKGMAANPHQFRLKKAGYNVLFFDEAHALSGTDSILSTSVNRMSQELGSEVAIYLMTGSPIRTHLHNVYGILRLINPDAYLNKASFMRQHCETATFRIPMGKKEAKVTKVVGYFNTEKIYRELWKNARRVQKRDVIVMPEPVISQVRVHLSGEHLRLYRKIVNDRFAVLGDRVLAPDNQSALRHLALQLISCPDEFDPTGRLSKDNELAAAADELLDSINPADHKVIVFAYYKKTIEFLAKRYQQWNPAVVYGESAAAEKDIRRFKEDDSCRLIIINWISGGAGLNLQVAHHIMFYECPTSPGDAKQAIARADRKGQAHIVNVYFLRVMGTLLDRNFKNLLKNEEEGNKVIRDRKDLLYELLRGEASTLTSKQAEGINPRAV